MIRYTHLRWVSFTCLVDSNSFTCLVDSNSITWLVDSVTMSLMRCVVGQWKTAGKDCKISGFSDKVISKGRVIIDLIEAIKPGSVKYNVVKAGDNDEVYTLVCHHIVVVMRPSPRRPRYALHTVHSFVCLSHAHIRKHENIQRSNLEQILPTSEFRT